mmetsp:Transcript_9000/g.13608  ORF Transcript_9000/g.13608 Transcript_9000/m.13608 type:complete len:2173 (-) Transcript_9000:100-6618(-)
MLLGITRDSILRCDPKTMEVVKSYPFTALKRWASSNKTITLDWGDNEAEYYRALTQHGEKISALISGYIDIILKRRVVGAKLAARDDSKVATSSRVTPVHGVAATAQAVSVGRGGGADGNARQMMLGPDGRPIGYAPGAQGQGFNTPGGAPGSSSSATLGEQITITDLPTAIQGIDLLSKALGAPLPQQYQVLSPDQAAQTFSEAAVGIHKGMSQVISNLGQMDASQMASTGKYLHDHLTALISAARRAGDEGDANVSLLDGAYAMSEAVANLLQCAKDAKENPDDQAKYAKLIAASKLYNAAHFALASRQRGTLTDEASEQLLLSSSRLSAAAVKDFAKRCEEAGIPLSHIEPMLGSSSLLCSAAMSLSRAMIDPQCQAAMIELIQGLQQQAGTLYNTAQSANLGESALTSITQSAQALTSALTQLLDVAQCPMPVEAELANKIPELCQNAQDAIQMLREARGQTAVMSAASALELQLVDISKAAKACGSLLPADSDEAKALLASAAAVVTASNSMKKAADENDKANALKFACDAGQQLESIENNAARYAAYGRLLEASKSTAATLTGLTALSMSVSAKSSDPKLATELLTNAGSTSSNIQQFVGHIKMYSQNSTNPTAQKNLYLAAKASTPPASQLVAVGTKTVPTISDRKDNKRLNEACSNASDALSKLLKACGDVADTMGGKELAKAKQELQQALAELNTLLISAQSGALATTRDPEAATKAYQLIREAILRAAQGVKHLTQVALQQPESAGPYAAQLSKALLGVVAAAKELAGHCDNRGAQTRVLSGAKKISESTSGLLTSVQGIISDPNPALQKELQSSSAALSEAFSAFLNIARGAGSGASEECAKAAMRVDEELQGARFAQGTYTNPDPHRETFLREAKALRAALATLGGGLDQVRNTAQRDPKQLGVAASSTADTFVNAFSASMAGTITACGEEDVRQRLVNGGRQCGTHVSKAIASSKAAKVDPRSATALTESIKHFHSVSDQLVQALDEATPGKLDVAMALARIDDALAAPRSNEGSVSEINRSSKQLGGVVAKMVGAARKNPAGAASQATDATENVRSVVICAKRFESEAAEASRVLIPLFVALSENIEDRNECLRGSRKILEASTPLFKSMREAAAKASTDQERKNATNAINACSAGVKKVLGIVTAAHSSKNPAQSLAVANKQVPVEVGRLKEIFSKMEQAMAPASSFPPEFATLSHTGFELSDAMRGMLVQLGLICEDPNDRAARQALTANQKKVATSIRRLLELSKALSPAQKECDQALVVAQHMVEDLEAVDFEIMSGVADSSSASCHQTHEQFVQTLVDALAEIDRIGSKLADPTNPTLGTEVSRLAATLPKFSTAAKDTVYTSSGDVQSERLELTKKLGDHIIAMIEQLKLAAADSEDLEAANKLRSSIADISTGIKQLSSKLQSSAMLLKQCDEAVQSIDTTAIKTLALPLSVNAPAKPTPYGVASKQLNETSNELKGALSNVAKSASRDQGKFGHEVAATAQLINSNFVQRVRNGARTLGGANAQQSVITAANDVVKQAQAVLQASKQIVVDPEDEQKQAKMSAALRHSRNAIITLINSMRAGATGAKACNAAVSELGELIQELDADYLYAASGQMDTSEIDPNASLTKTHQELLSAAEKVSQDLAQLHSPEASTSQTVVGNSASSIASNAKELAFSTKTLAVLLGDLNSQQTLLSGAKNAATGAQECVLSARQLLDSPTDDVLRETSDLSKRAAESAIKQLIDAANVASADIIKGHKELENAKRTLAALLSGPLSKIPAAGSAGNSQATPDDIVLSLRSIAKETANLVAASNSSQDELVKVIRSMTAANDQLVQNMVGSLRLTPDNEVHKGLMEATKSNVHCASSLFDMIRAQRSDNPQSQQHVSEASTALADSLHATVVAARRLPGGEHLELEENDLGSLAEKELLAAAAAIEAAANRLMRLPTRPEKTTDDFLDEHDVAEAIIGAARAITDATRTLVQAATSVQKELKAAGKASPHLNVYKKDPAWAQGLISAAQAVAGTTEDLVDAANGVVKGDADDARLIAAVRMVGGATARLVTASRVKADPNSPSQRRLEAAAQAVARATKHLSEAAQKREEIKSGASSAKLSEKDSAAQLSAVQARRKALEQQAKIERLRKQLEAAEKEVYTDRRKEYTAGSSSSAASSSSMR